MAGLEKHGAYLEAAKRELGKLESQIKDLRKKQQDGKRAALEPERPRPIDLEGTFKDLQSRVHDTGEYFEELLEKARQFELKEVRGQIDELKDTGEQRLAELREESEQRWFRLQAQAEAGFWEFRALLKRVSEGIAPILHAGDEPRKSRYYFQKARQGRWALVQEGADAPTMFFDSKRDGLKEARQYVRDRRPSELVIRRLDGTFQSVHQYKA